MLNCCLCLLSNTISSLNLLGWGNFSVLGTKACPKGRDTDRKPQRNISGSGVHRSKTIPPHLRDQIGSNVVKMFLLFSEGIKGRRAGLQGGVTWASISKKNTFFYLLFIYSKHKKEKTPECKEAVTYVIIMSLNFSFCKSFNFIYMNIADKK